MLLSVSESPSWSWVHTAIVNHAGTPTSLDAASRAMRSNTEWIVFGAGVTSGRAKRALMRALRGSESFDMLEYALLCGMEQLD